MHAAMDIDLPVRAGGTGLCWGEGVGGGGYTGTVQEVTTMLAGPVCGGWGAVAQSKMSKGYIRAVGNSSIWLPMYRAVLS